MSLRIILADDHPIFLLGLGAVLSKSKDFFIVGEATSPKELLELLAQEDCDLLVTDFMMPADNQNDGLRLIERVRRLHPTLPIIVVTMLHNPALFTSILALGVKGLLSKSSLSHELPTAIKAASVGRLYIAQSVKNAIEMVGGCGADHLVQKEELSPRELEVIRLLASGLASREIAKLLNRSKQTVSAQKVSAMRKLGITNDAAFFIYAQEHGLLS
ncbi:response regulator transcription factor [Pseudomonas sp. 6D_7.1_Bac1]|uniref:response regulator transcription factor n=1 Tax=Pseudomonas sp. 6D_7.1_Bac1 TaxID=2971615 RepID=UPI0021C92AFD|nr:response regulator transcription factor [Pseudomonas sp. 6D_7.1_Bac1]MCU1748829.1 response regulator transcription factor [Pseudomonas sp. 6D_7.1_Bac1]